MDTIKAAQAALKASREAGAKVRETAGALRTRYDELTAERDRVRHQLAPLAECLANVDRLVDGERAEFVRRRGKTVAAAVSGGLGLEMAPGEDKVIVERKRGPALPRFGEIPYSLTIESLCAYAPEVVKANLRAIVTAAKADHFGGTEAERQKVLAELEAEIAKVAEDHTALVDEARGLGIELPLLSHVLIQRQREERGDLVPVVVPMR